MKIKITILLSGLLAAAAFSGCTAEGDMPSAQPLTAIRAVNTGLSGVSSRSQVGGIADDGSLVMQWSPGDRIGVFGASQSNVCFTSANETAADETTFSYSGTFSGTPSTAYYPYTEGAADAAAVPVNIPAVQTYSDVTSVAAYDFKASSSAERQSDGSYRMRFRSMVTLLRLQIDLSAVSGLAADETLLSIRMTAGTGSLSGAFTCDLNNPDAGLTPVDAAATLTGHGRAARPVPSGDGIRRGSSRMHRGHQARLRHHHRPACRDLHRHAAWHDGGRRVLRCPAQRHGARQQRCRHQGC